MTSATIDRATFESELKRDGYEVLVSTTPGAKVNPPHSHPFDVQALVLKGAVTLTVDGASRTYETGDVFTMARGCQHFESYDDRGAEVLLGRRM